MKRFLLISLVILVALAAGGFYIYRTVMPGLIADAVTSDTSPEYIPKRIQNRVEAIRKPINKGTEAIIEKMHASEIPVQDVLSAVDNITEDQAHAFLDEVNEVKPESTDEFFDVAKRHFDTDFDPEVFREPFKKHFKIDQLRSAVKYANLNRTSNDVDITTAKAIVKKIILEKEKEVSQESAE